MELAVEEPGVKEDETDEESVVDDDLIASVQGLTKALDEAKERFKKEEARERQRAGEVKNEGHLALREHISQYDTECTKR